MNWKSWKTWAVIAILLLGGFAIYSVAAPGVMAPAPTAKSGGSDDPEAPGARVAGKTATTRNEASNVTIPPIRMADLDSPSVRDYSSKRNLFAFVVPPPPPIPKPKPPPPPPPVVCTDTYPDSQYNASNAYPGDPCAAKKTEYFRLHPPPPPKVPPPAFPYKYMGTFGNPASPIAAFSGNGEIINARVGDVIKGQFILRSIGIESVKIGFTGFPAEEMQTIGIGAQ